MGMGLFLVRKILGLHGMKVSISNVDGGVRAVVEREKKTWKGK